MARRLALTAVLLAVLLPVSGAGGADAQAPTRGGTIVVLRPSQTEPACLNVFACGGDTAAISSSISQVLEGAFEPGPDLVIRPNLVSDVDHDGRTLTYHVRPEARWSDGTPVTASDFWFTQRAFARLSLPGDSAGAVQELYRRVRRTRVLDPKTFRVELHRPFSDWRALYSIVLPRHVLAGQDLRAVWTDGVDDPRVGTPIGSGPFLVRSWERGKQLTLVRNPHYWGRHTAYLDRFVYRFVRADLADPLAPLRDDEVDVALSLGGAFVSADLARQVRAIPGWGVEAWPTTGFEHLVFRVGSGGHPALKNRRVRQALAFGVDRVAIARAILQEAPRSARRPMDSATFLPTDASYRSAWSGYRYDVGRARGLLEHAGCTRGSDLVYRCRGARLSLRFVTTSGFPVREEVLELVAAQLRRVGVEVDPAYVAPATFFSQYLPSGDFDAALFTWVALGGIAPPEAKCGDVQNWAGFCRTTISGTARLADRLLDPARRARVLNELDVLLAREVPILPIVQPVFRAALRDTVRGVYPGGSQFEFSQNSEDWWLDD